MFDLGSGLAFSTRTWYCAEILKVLRKHGKVSAPFIISEMRKIPQRRLPVTEERIVSFLKYMRACNLVTYHRSETRRISSKWESRESRI